MKNPLYKRLPREFRKDFGKYAVIFLFLTATIGFVSGFLVADNSLTTAYDESFEAYHIEDGHFTLDAAMDDSLAEAVQDEAVTVYQSFYKEESDKDADYRIFINRDQINLISVLQGRLAESDDEIAIDRLFAENNNIAVGDTVTLAGKSFTVCGLTAFSDYSALFRNNTDMMFDAQHFTVAAVTEEAFDALPDTHLTYTYSWRYNNDALSASQKADRAEALMTAIAQRTSLTDFVPREENQAIQFTGDDMGSDKAMMICLLYIVIVIMAFVFAVTTSNTIEQESTVIGTLRASGYTRGELLRHYLLLPVLVTLIGAAIGNLLGYTFFKNTVADMYYGSYSLPAYTTLWSAYAFVMTTVVPCGIMLVVNLLILKQKLSLPPLSFLRRDLTKNKSRRAVRLPRFKFLSRFRLRVILQNLHSYGLMFIGILFANIILLFGMMMTPLMDHYRADVLDSMICNYQYILKAPAQTEQADAEKFSVTGLDMDLNDSDRAEEITVYGIQQNSAYLSVPLDTGGGVTVSEGILEKYGLKIGDIIQLKTKFDNTTYAFRITGSCRYPSSLAVFMDIGRFRTVFDQSDDYFNGYFSNTQLTDLPENSISSTITQSDLTILSDQMTDSMGGIFPMVAGFALLLYMLLVYLLSKIIIEKNAGAVSMVKILGYRTREIARLYLSSTAAVVVLSLLASLPLCYLVIRAIYVQMMSSFSGWLTFYIDPVIYLKMFLLGLASYAVVGALQFWKIRRIPMGEALKNTE